MGWLQSAEYEVWKRKQSRIYENRSIYGGGYVLEILTLNQNILGGIPINQNKILKLLV